MNLPTQFDESLRYLYDLTPDSRVIDCGGYHGQWTKEVVRRYECFVDVFEPVFWRECAAALTGLPKVTIHPVAVGAKNESVRIGIHGGLTGVFCGDAGDYFASIDFTEWFARRNYPTCLLKLNVEGSEFVLVDRLVHSGQIRSVKNLQVQFHHIFDWCEADHRRLRAMLSETHELTYDFDVWENWRIK